MVAKLEVKLGTGGGIPVEIKPSLGDLLLPCHRSVDEFDKAIVTMQGFQRVESTFPSPDDVRSELPSRIIKTVALTPVKTLKWKDDQIRLAGLLPASLNPVLVLIKCPKDSKEGKIIVCCDQAVAVNAIMNVLRKLATTR